MGSSSEHRHGNLALSRVHSLETERRALSARSRTEAGRMQARICTACLWRAAAQLSNEGGIVLTRSIAISNPHAEQSVDAQQSAQAVRDSC
jgi:hypothetical protein